MQNQLEIAIEGLQTHKVVLVKNKKIVDAQEGRGLEPLFRLLSKNSLEGASLADRVIGSAAALLLAPTGVKEVYGKVLSRGAKERLEQANIRVHGGKLVDRILNRRGDDLCPMEKMALAAEDREDFLKRFQAFRKQAASSPKDPSPSPDEKSL